MTSSPWEENPSIKAKSGFGRNALRNLEDWMSHRATAGRFLMVLVSRVIGQIVSGRFKDRHGGTILMGKPTW